MNVCLIHRFIQNAESNDKLVAIPRAVHLTDFITSGQKYRSILCRSTISQMNEQFSFNYISKAFTSPQSIVLPQGKSYQT